MRTLLALLLLAGAATAGLDDGPRRPGEWGFRPAEGSVSRRTPPSFAWRPQRGARRYALLVTREGEVVYRASDIGLSVHCPPRVLPPGEYTWRYRAEGSKEWSRPRSFRIARDAVPFPMPERAELLARVPKVHPRLFLRPGEVAGIRKLASGKRKKEFDRLVAVCEKLLANPPDTSEPPLYPPGMERRGEEWRKMWWGNRTLTIRVLDGAATLAFVSLIGGREDFGRLAKKLLLEAAAWDPTGATGYRYNDEAGMPYAYHFSRAYTFLHDRLTEPERERCRQVMRIRGREMFSQLYPHHLWWPYGSHANRAWHFLGEVAIAFFGEIEDAGDWLWFAMNVFFNVYPVWSDPDGGWHEGSNYWKSYVGRFTWWADVMKSATGIDAYRLPYFGKAGDYAMVLLPPGTKGGGFGDLTARITSGHMRDIMTVLARQARNPYWQWYVNAIGGPRMPVHYVSFLRGAGEPVTPEPPGDLPASRCFYGNGLAVLNCTLLDAKENVEVVFKSSPMGSQSHGYEAQNAFLLYAYGERLFIRTGRRDMYGSEHHRFWMWQTKSVNSISVNGRGQRAHAAGAVGRITAFQSTAQADYVEGEAAAAYAGNVQSFRRGILFVKPDLVVVHDRLRTERDSAFTWHLHSPVPMKLRGNELSVENGPAACRVWFLRPADLGISVTDRFDPPPRPRIRLTEYHLTASPKGRAKEVEFLTVFRPYRTGTKAPERPELVRTETGRYRPAGSRLDLEGF